MTPTNIGRLLPTLLLVFALTSCVLAGTGCARNPVSGRPEMVLVSAAQERDPLKRARHRLTSESERLRSLEAEVAYEIQQAIEIALLPG